MIPRPTLRALVALTAALLALVATACGSGTSAYPPDDELSTTAPSSRPAFPVTVEGGNGPVEIVEQPTRIVSLSASVTEVLFAIGAGDQVVAVDQYSDFPAEAPTTDLSGFRPNLEAIAGHEPDLVVLSSDRDAVVRALTDVGIPALVLASPDDLDALYDHIGVLGTATGRASEADALVGDLRRQLDELAAGVPERDGPLRYLYELSDSYHSITSETFIGELVALAGMVSIADDAGDTSGGYPHLSAEYVLDADPDVIVVAHTDGTVPELADIAARPGWEQLTAVRAGNIVVLDPDVASRWGPRIVDLLRTVVDATADLPAR